MDGSQGGMEEARIEPAAVRRFLSDNPEFLTGDDGLLDELGLKVASGNVVEFAPAAMARVHAAHQREATQRQQIEETARANFSAQGPNPRRSRGPARCAKSFRPRQQSRRTLAQQRFGLAAGVSCSSKTPRAIRLQAGEGWSRVRWT